MFRAFRNIFRDRRADLEARRKQIKAEIERARARHEPTFHLRAELIGVTHQVLGMRRGR